MSEAMRRHCAAIIKGAAMNARISGKIEAAVVLDGLIPLIENAKPFPSVRPEAVAPTDQHANQMKAWNAALYAAAERIQSDQIHVGARSHFANVVRGIVFDSSKHSLDGPHSP